MKILRRRLVRPKWTKTLRELEMEKECLSAPIEHMGTIRTMATRLKEEGLHFTFSTEGDNVLVWKIPIPARQYRKI